MSQEGATSIQDLQNQSPQNQGGENGSRAVVQEILQEIENNDNKNAQQNTAQQQYNMDSSVQQGSFAPQSQEDAERMQQEMMMQQQQQQQMMQMQMEQENQETPQIIQQKQKPQTFVEKIIGQIKAPLIVAAIFLLLSLVPTKQLLQKVPRALTETGGVTFVGSAVTAVIAGILFYAVSLATKNI